MADATNARNVPGPSGFSNKKRKSNTTSPDCDVSMVKKTRFLKDVVLTRYGGVLEGRVTSKTPIKEWSKNGKEGKLFSFLMADETARISVIVSGDKTDEVFSTIQVNHCYRITGFKPKPVNPHFSSTDHECEVTLSKISKIKEIERDDIPQTQSLCSSIASILNIEKNCLIDLTAILFDLLPVQNITCRDGSIQKKQTALLVDDSKKIVSLDLWN
ncbi:replication protein A 70 kDa DNA-binding subunit-like, partial [Galendromus occidentalis]